MTDSFQDPAVNFAVPENQPVGLRIPEYVIRQLISYALSQIRVTLDNPVNLIDELFAMTGPTVIAQIKDWMRTHENIYVGVSWPQEDFHLPAIAVINQGETEVQEQAFLGDAAGRMTYGTIDGRGYAREHRAVPMRHATNIYIASSNPELTLYLYNIVRFILVSNKSGLTEWYDIHNLVVSGQPVEYDEKMMPAFGYYRMVSLQYLTLFDYNVSEEAAKIVSLELFAEVADPNNPGVRVDVPVPSE